MLLFSYSLGFTHDLLPHCHHDAGTDKHVVEHSGHHHHHEGHEGHDKHADEGLVDLLICLLSNTEHASNHPDDFFVVPSNIDQRTNDRLTGIQLAVLLQHFFYVPIGTPLPSEFNTASLALCAGPYLSASPERGPPVVS